MNIEFVNRICPNCKNPNYMVSLGNFAKVYKYKCMNCNRYFNDIDFEESLQPVWKTECMNTKVDMVEVVRCKDCKHYHEGFNCDLMQKPIFKNDEWFCADGELREEK